MNIKQRNLLISIQNEYVISVIILGIIIVIASTIMEDSARLLIVAILSGLSFFWGFNRIIKLQEILK